MIVVGTTLAPYVMDQVDTWAAWLYNAEQIAESHDVRFFAAIETDSRGIGFFQPLADRLRELGGEWWEFRFDDGVDQITTDNRLRRIVTGQNIVSMYTESIGATHLLFLAADTQAPDDTIPKFLEMDYPIIGGNLWETYRQDGPVVATNKRTNLPFGFEVKEQLLSVAFVMVETPLLKKIRWRFEPERGRAGDDDQCFCDDAARNGWPALVRTDVIGTHYPLAIPPIEDRGHDMKVYR